MAQNKNETHERNENDPNFVDADGWGIVTGRSGKVDELYKKDIACWNDPRFLDQYNGNADSVILHARKASSGKIDCSFTHPFEREGWYFCHNGTITQPPAGEKSDSEQFFALLLSNIKQHDNVKDAIKNAINQVKEFTALNFILANNKKAYVLVKYHQSSEYYIMKYLQIENCVIVSSEALPNFKGEWVKIENSSLVVLDIINRHIELSRLIKDKLCNQDSSNKKLFKVFNYILWATSLLQSNQDILMKDRLVFLFNGRTKP